MSKEFLLNPTLDGFAIAIVGRFASFFTIAWLAQRLNVSDMIIAATTKRYNMVGDQPNITPSTTKTLITVMIAETAKLFGREISFCPCFTGAPAATRSTRALPYFFRIVTSPAPGSFLSLLGVVFLPTPRQGAMSLFIILIPTAFCLKNLLAILAIIDFIPPPLTFYASPALIPFTCATTLAWTPICFTHFVPKSNSPLTCPESVSRRVRQRAVDWILSIVNISGKNPSAHEPNYITMALSGLRRV